MTRSTTTAIERLRARALAYPGATEEAPWGHVAIKVRGKTFVFLAGEDGTLGVTCKLPSSHGAALLLPFASPTGYGLGKSGWVTATFPAAAEPPIELLSAWIDESYRAVAPKTLAAQVSGGTGEVGARAKRGAAAGEGARAKRGSGAAGKVEATRAKRGTVAAGKVAREERAKVEETRAKRGSGAAGKVARARGLKVG